MLNAKRSKNSQKNDNAKKCLKETFEKISINLRTKYNYSQQKK